MALPVQVRSAHCGSRLLASSVRAVDKSTPHGSTVRPRSAHQAATDSISRPFAQPTSRNVPSVAIASVMCRRAWRQAPWDQDAAERIPGGGEDQVFSAQLSDTARALRVLSDEQSEALILVGAGGFSYEDAAAICKCAVGTVKSRVARARKALMEILDGDDTLDGVTRPAEGDAAREIMAQLDRLAPNESGEPGGKRRPK